MGRNSSTSFVKKLFPSIGRIQAGFGVKLAAREMPNCLAGFTSSIDFTIQDLFAFSSQPSTTSNRDLLFWLHYLTVSRAQFARSFPFVPPLVRYAPPSYNTCHYIVNHYVKIWHLRLGGANNMHPLPTKLGLGGHKGKRSNLAIWDASTILASDLFRLCPPPSLVGAYYLLICTPQTHVQFFT